MIYKVIDAFNANDKIAIALDKERGIDVAGYQHVLIGEDIFEVVWLHPKEFVILDSQEDATKLIGKEALFFLSDDSI